jgi:ubiquinone/menaquinone biosynthesis C-methylase UbiE
MSRAFPAPARSAPAAPRPARRPRRAASRAGDLATADAPRGGASSPHRRDPPPPPADDATRRVVTRRRSCLALALALGAAPPAPLASSPARAAAASDVAAAYDGYAATYDRLDASAFATDVLGLDSLRRNLLARASGDVLELGVGTGLNLPGYDASKLSTLTAVDISRGMLAEAEKRAETLPQFARRLGEGGGGETSSSAAGAGDPRPSRNPPSISLSFVLADASRLPFPDASFDCVVDTFSLCVMEDPLAALREVRRVLRPNGAALLVEHTRSAEAPLLGWYQSVTARAVRATAKGCDWSQDALGLVERAGFDVRRAEPSLVGLLTTIEATPRPS